MHLPDRPRYQEHHRFLRYNSAATMDQYNGKVTPGESDDVSLDSATTDVAGGLSAASSSSTTIVATNNSKKKNYNATSHAAKRARPRTLSTGDVTAASSTSSSAAATATTDSTASTVASAASAMRIRSRYLHRLGISGAAGPPTSPPRVALLSSSPSAALKTTATASTDNVNAVKTGPIRRTTFESPRPKSLCRTDQEQQQEQAHRLHGQGCYPQHHCRTAGAPIRKIAFLSDPARRQREEPNHRNLDGSSTNTYVQVLKSDLGRSAETLTLDSPPATKMIQPNDHGDGANVASRAPAAAFAAARATTTARINNAMSSGSSCASTSSSSSSVCFQAQVKVHEIPHFSNYSSDVQQSLWMSVVEVQECLARNCWEFAFENWDWRQVVEEDDFVWLKGGGWVHPSHFSCDADSGRDGRYSLPRRRQLCTSLQKQFFLVLSQQQQQQQQQQLYEQLYYQQQQNQQHHGFVHHQGSVYATHTARPKRKVLYR